MLEMDISTEPAPTGLGYIRTCGNSFLSQRRQNQKYLGLGEGL
ncbi:hypothetical protein PL11201_130017 [Planktothrix sp. PCC 11201]|nr:hypothetical protein PL11201_130017 [Planktothrix sp. PCC 11201]